MDLIGKTTINPVLFYSGKVCGYFTWAVLLFQLLEIEFLSANSNAYDKYAALFILILGLAAIVISLINLGSSTRLGLPTDNTELKSNGIYRLSRNPMYLGFNLLTLSSITYTQNLVIPVLGIYSIVVYHLIILGEEKFLKEKFGNVYSDYCKEVRRYI